MMLSDIIKHLKEQTKAVTDNPVLNAFDLNKCSEIDSRAPNEQYISEKRKKCLGSLSSCGIDYTDHYKKAFDAYNEIVVFDYLNSKISIEYQLERKGESTPDFVLTMGTEERINLELKTLSYNHDILNYRDIQTQALNSKISMEEQLRKGGTLAIGDAIVYPPFRKFKTKNDWSLEHYSCKGVIEGFIDKINGRFNPAQLNYANRNGILLIDTVLLQHPIFQEEGLPVFVYPNGLNSLKSGCLWHACFGKEGERLFDAVEFEGERNITNTLSKSGLLVGETSLKAVAFLLHIGNEVKIVGFHKYDLEDEDLLLALGRLCDFVNDDSNTRYYKKSLDPFQSFKESFNQ